MIDKFDEFVRKQIKSPGTTGGTLDLEKEKRMWLNKLDQLYSLVGESLSSYLADGSIKLEYSVITLTEELLGDYPVQEARIIVGQQVVKLKPVGTFLIGARGRVDMSGPRGTIRFTIVPPDTRELRFRVTTVMPGDPPPTPDPVIPPETWVWKIATPPPRITYIDLTQESFREALIGVVNG